jgi:hypothetical protein
MFHIKVIQHAEAIMSISELRHWFALRRLEYCETASHIELPLPLSHISTFLDPLQDIIEASEYEDGDSNSAEIERGSIATVASMNPVVNVCVCTQVDRHVRNGRLCQRCALEHTEWHGIDS